MGRVDSCCTQQRRALQEKAKNKATRRNERRTRGEHWGCSSGKQRNCNDARWKRPHARNRTSSTYRHKREGCGPARLRKVSGQLFTVRRGCAELEHGSGNVVIITAMKPCTTEQYKPPLVFPVLSISPAHETVFDLRGDRETQASTHRRSLHCVCHLCLRSLLSHPIGSVLTSVPVSGRRRGRGSVASLAHTLPCSVPDPLSSLPPGPSPPCSRPLLPTSHRRRRPTASVAHRHAPAHHSQARRGRKQHRHR